VRFLADESCDFAVVRALRAVGHDVVAIAEISPRATDEVVMELAIHEGRILLTEDKDFGQLVHANQAAAGGVFLLRFPARARADLPGAVVNLVERRGEGLLGRFVVLQPGRVRIGRPPAG
jgi:predicted nuclease of predicted toxin-antitoxin system